MIQNLQRSPIPLTSNWSGTFFCCFLQQTGSSQQVSLCILLRCSSWFKERLKIWFRYPCGENAKQSLYILKACHSQKRVKFREKRGPRKKQFRFMESLHHTAILHSCSFCLENLAKNSGSFCYKNLLFHKVKHSLKWSSGVPYCSLLKPMSKDSF